MEEVFKPWKLTYDLVGMTDLKVIKKAIKPSTSLIWIESLSNPQLKISDIAAISKIAKNKNILCVVDNT